MRKVSINELIEQFFLTKLSKIEKVGDSWSLTFKPGIMLTWSDVAWLRDNGWHIYGLIHSPTYLIVQITDRGPLAS